MGHVAKVVSLNSISKCSTREKHRLNSFTAETAETSGNQTVSYHHKNIYINKNSRAFPARRCWRQSRHLLLRAAEWQEETAADKRLERVPKPRWYRRLFLRSERRGGRGSASCRWRRLRSRCVLTLTRPLALIGAQRIHTQKPGSGAEGSSFFSVILLPFILMALTSRVWGAGGVAVGGGASVWHKQMNKNTLLTAGKWFNGLMQAFLQTTISSFSRLIYPNTRFFRHLNMMLERWAISCQNDLSLFFSILIYKILSSAGHTTLRTRRTG